MGNITLEKCANKVEEYSYNSAKSGIAWAILAVAIAIDNLFEEFKKENT